MIIGIDGSLLTGKRTGMGNVLYNILLNLKKREDTKYVLYVKDDLDENLHRNILEKNFTVKKIGYVNYFVWEQVILPYYAKKDRIDIFWFPNNTGSIGMKCKKIVTIHDLIFMNKKEFKPPTLYKKIGKMYRRLIVPIIAKKSEKIITISKASKNEIISYFPNLEKKIEVIYNGINTRNEKLLDNEWKVFCDKNKIKEDFVLSFGALEQRKNTMTVVKVFEELNEIQLVLVGFRGYKKSKEYKYITNKGIDNICVLEYVTDKELNSLYNKARAFMFLSLKEGFGLPILEAMSNDALVITSNVSCMPEIGGNAAIYVEPSNIDEIRTKLIEIFENKKIQEQIKAKYDENLKRFSWEKTANSVIKVLKTTKDNVGDV